jgi:hypothetical protein
MHSCRLTTTSPRDSSASRACLTWRADRPVRSTSWATVSAHTSAPSPVVSSSAVRMAACRSPSPRPIGLVVPSGVDVFHRRVWIGSRLYVYRPALILTPTVSERVSRIPDPHGRVRSPTRASTHLPSRSRCARASARCRDQVRQGSTTPRRRRRCVWPRCARPRNGPVSTCMPRGPRPLRTRAARRRGRAHRCRPLTRTCHPRSSTASLRMARRHTSRSCRQLGRLPRGHP